MNGLESHLKKSKKENDLEVIKKYVDSVNEEALIECLEKTLINGEKIGVGNNAEIIQLQEPFRSICVKVVKKNPLVIVNTLNEEFKFQQDVNNLGIKTPKSLLRVKNIHTNQEYLVMEKIEGFSFKEIIDNPLFDDKNFDLENIFKKITEMIELMHKNGIYHRDLHAGNIMYDTNNNTPVIIDFGHALKSYFSDPEPRDVYENQYAKMWDTEKERHVSHDNVRFYDDDKKLKEIKKELQVKFLKNNDLT
jgi:tRNA A-37 threonylcarbamoyl transferase component Bud32